MNLLCRWNDILVLSYILSEMHIFLKLILNPHSADASMILKETSFVSPSRMYIYDIYCFISSEEKKMKAKSDKSNTADLMSGSKMASSSFLADFDLCASMPSSLKLLFTAHECLGRRVLYLIQIMIFSIV